MSTNDAIDAASLTEHAPSPSHVHKDKNPRGQNSTWLRGVLRRIRAGFRRREHNRRIGRLYGMIIDRLDTGLELRRPDFERVVDDVRGSEPEGGLLIGLTVHESPECVIDQVANLARFAPEAGVVVHLARAFRRRLGIRYQDLAEDLARANPLTIVNPTSFDTVYASGSLLQAQVSNWLVGRAHGRFGRFVTMSSNELLVREGIEEHLSRADVAVSFNPIDVPGATGGMWRSRQRRASILGDPIFAHVMGRTPGRPIVQGIHEGFCMRAEFWDEFASVFDLEFPHREIQYPTEEIYLQNLVAPFLPQLRVVPPICARRLRGATEAMIREISSGESPHHFSVKRVARSLDDPIRRFVRDLPV